MLFVEYGLSFLLNWTNCSPLSRFRAQLARRHPHPLDHIDAAIATCFHLHHPQNYLHDPKNPMYFNTSLCISGRIPISHTPFTVSMKTCIGFMHFLTNYYPPNLPENKVVLSWLLPPLQSQSGSLPRSFRPSQRSLLKGCFVFSTPSLSGPTRLSA